MLEGLSDFLKSEKPFKFVTTLEQKGDVYTVRFKERTLPMILAKALKQIDPEIQHFPSSSDAWSGGNQEDAEHSMLSHWQRVIDELRKKYPMQKQKTP